MGFTKLTSLPEAPDGRRMRATRMTGSAEAMPASR